MQMGKHGPEPPQPLGRQGNAKSRRIPAEESFDEILTPVVTFSVVPRQEGTRKPSAFPELVGAFGPGFRHVKAAQLHEGYSTSQRFGCAANQVR